MPISFGSCPGAPPCYDYIVIKDSKQLVSAYRTTRYCGASDDQNSVYMLIRNALVSDDGFEAYIQKNAMNEPYAFEPYETNDVCFHTLKTKDESVRGKIFLAYEYDLHRKTLVTYYKGKRLYATKASDVEYLDYIAKNSTRITVGLATEEFSKEFSMSLYGAVINTAIKKHVPIEDFEAKVINGLLRNRIVIQRDESAIAEDDAEWLDLVLHDGNGRILNTFTVEIFQKKRGEVTVSLPLLLCDCLLFTVASFKAARERLAKFVSDPAVVEEFERLSKVYSASFNVRFQVSTFLSSAYGYRIDKIRELLDTLSVETMETFKPFAEYSFPRLGLAFNAERWRLALTKPLWLRHEEVEDEIRNDTYEKKEAEREKMRCALGGAISVNEGVPL